MYVLSIKHIKPPGGLSINSSCHKDSTVKHSYKPLDMLIMTAIITTNIRSDVADIQLIFDGG